MKTKPADEKAPGKHQDIEDRLYEVILNLPPWAFRIFVIAVLVLCGWLFSLGAQDNYGPDYPDPFPGLD
jgi:hypothetical protein